jgi:formamidopyrimidine-DNA glycosylase
MPELPEVECLRRTLEPVLVSARIESVRVRRRSFVEAAGFEDASDALSARAAPLAGSVIVRLGRHGKEIAIVTSDSGPALRVRLGMTGGMRIEPATIRPVPLPHEHVRWTLSGPGGRFHLRHTDPRRFGDLLVFPDASTLDLDRDRRLGPDALGTPPSRLAELLSKPLGATARPLKVALLDQSVLAGLGNIYADESLFHAGLSPVRPARSLDRSERERLAASIRLILQDAVGRGGSTLRDYRDAQGRPGSAQTQHRVYGRVGEACFRCGLPISGTTLGGRTTASCSRCQQ